MKIDIPHFGNSFSVEASQVIYAGGAIDSGIRLASLKKEMSDLDVEKERQELQLTRLRNTGKVMNRKIQPLVPFQKQRESTAGAKRSQAGGNDAQAGPGRHGYFNKCRISRTS